MFSLRKSHTSDSNTHLLKTRATVTIIIVTLVYIAFNLPAVLNYSRYMILIYVTGIDFLDASNSKANKFLQNHIWVLAYVITVALNSLVNPLVYMLRMSSFREKMVVILKRETKEKRGQYKKTSTTTATGSRV